MWRAKADEVLRPVLLLGALYERDLLKLWPVGRCCICASELLFVAALVRDGFPVDTRILC